MLQNLPWFNVDKRLSLNAFPWHVGTDCVSDISLSLIQVQPHLHLYIYFAHLLYYFYLLLFICISALLYFELHIYFAHLICYFSFFPFFFFCLLSFYGHTYGIWSSQARGLIRVIVPAYTIATATPAPRCICSLHHSPQQCQILNPLSKAGDWTCNLMVPNQIHFNWATMGTLVIFFLMPGIFTIISFDVMFSYMRFPPVCKLLKDRECLIDLCIPNL